MYLREEALDSVGRFIAVTATSWMDNGLIKPNSYGVGIHLANQPGSNFMDALTYDFGESRDGGKHAKVWYMDNAEGKIRICLKSGMDSHEAIRVWQGTLLDLENAFPWGGAVIDTHYGLIVGVSGFEEDEDILFARTIRNWVVKRMDRIGQARLEAARQRGELWSDDGSVDDYRFTRVD